MLDHHDGAGQVHLGEGEEALGKHGHTIVSLRYAYGVRETQKRTWTRDANWHAGLVSSHVWQCEYVLGRQTIDHLTRYNMLALTTTMLSLITGTKFVLGLHERKNYSTQQPDQDVRKYFHNPTTFITL